MSQTIVGAFKKWVKGKHIYSLTVYGMVRDASGTWLLDDTAGGGTTTLPPNNATGNPLKGVIDGIRIEDTRQLDMIQSLDRVNASYENTLYDYNLILTEILANRVPAVSQGAGAWAPVIPEMLANYDALKIYFQRGQKISGVFAGDGYLAYGRIAGGTDGIEAFGKNIAQCRIVPVDMGDDNSGNPIPPLQYFTAGSI